MRIVVDARTLFAEAPRGTGKAFLEVYRRLPAMHGDWEFMFLHRNRQIHNRSFAERPNVSVQYTEIRGERFNLWQSLRLPLTAKLKRADVLHCPANLGPRCSATPILVTIHDLIPMQADFRTHAMNSWGKRVGRIAHQARIVTTPSEFSRLQIIETFGLPEHKVVSIPWAANSSYHPLPPGEESNSIRTRYQIETDQPYVLAFGAEDPRKNTKRILEAWSGLSSADRRDAVLIIVGLQERFRETLLASIERSSAVASVRLFGYIPEEDVPRLLGGAEFLCFPTLYEGFGLPVLDAFACDTAVLTSHNSSIPEVAGEAVMYVDPGCTQAITAAMATLLREPATRQRLVEVGRQQAQKFSWDRCAKQYSDVLQRFAK